MKPIKNHGLKLVLTAAITLLAGLAPAWSQETLPLSELYRDTDKAVTVLEAEAATEAARQEAERDRAESGLRFTIGGGYGLVRNIVDVHKAFTYSAAQAQAGFSLPLFGAAEQNERRVDVDEGKQHEGQIRSRAARGLAQLELESSYAQYWGAQESLKVVQAYLNSEEPVLSKLKLRAQHRMTLRSELLDTQAAYAQAKVDELRFRRSEDDARSRLQRLTGRSLGAFTAVPVTPSPAPEVQIDQLLQRHPDIALLRAQRDALKAQLDDSSWYGFEGSFDIIGNGVRDISQNGPNGGTAFVGLTFKMPIGVFSAASAQHKQLRAQMEEIRLKIQDRSEQLSGEVQSAQQQLNQSQQDQVQIEQKVQASNEGLRETYLRGNVIAEEGIETLARRLHAYYAAALDDIDGRVKAWQANVSVRGYAIAEDVMPQENGDSASGDLGAQLADPIVQVGSMLQGHSSIRPASEGGGSGAPAARRSPVAMSGSDTLWLTPAVYTPAIAPAPQPRPARADATAPAPFVEASSSAAAPRAPPPPLAPRLSLSQQLGGAAAATPGLAAYVRDSAELIETARSDAQFWQRLSAAGVTQLLLTLDQEQADAVQAQAPALRGFLEAARAHGVKVQLLLSEPGWIEPSQRPAMLAIIEGLRSFDFAGLNLDLEPERLYLPLDGAHYQAWMDTLRAAAQASPWPTGVSVHPRYFRDPPYASWNTARRLQEAGISEVVLQIYNTDPVQAARIARSIAANSPALRFSVAQSLEASREPQSSYARRSPQQFREAMRQLQSLLAAQPNNGGVVVQAWNELSRMGLD